MLDGSDTALAMRLAMLRTPDGGTQEWRVVRAQFVDYAESGTGRRSALCMPARALSSSLPRVR
jgi:hypothetical protein